MTGLPCKLMMSVIILSCGLIVHAEPSAHGGSRVRHLDATSRVRQTHRAVPAGADALRTLRNIPRLYWGG